MTNPKPSEQPLYDKKIVYDRVTKDFAGYLDGELVCFGKTYHEVEVALDQLVYDRISREAK